MEKLTESFSYRKSVIKVLIAVLYLAASAESVTIQCEFQQVSWVVIGINYDCLGNFISGGDGSTISEVTGSHIDGWDNSDVGSVNFQGQQILTRIPSNLHEFFPNLIGIQFYSGILSVITAEDLAPFPELQVLGLSLNQIVRLESDLFRNSPRLRWVSFYSNQLTSVGSNLFAGTYIETAFFQFNPCINVYADSPAAIADLERQLPVQCPLVSQDITFNCIFREIVWAAIGAEYGCEPVVVGAGNDTTLVEVTGEHERELTNDDVRILDVRGAQALRSLPRNIQGFFPNLLGIQWSGDLETITANDLAPFPNLQVLSLSNNPIQVLPSNLFANNQRLIWISFFNNSLQNVATNLFAGLTSLQTANFLENPCISILARTPEEIQALNVELPFQCPSGETAITLQCTYRKIEWAVVGTQYGCEPVVLGSADGTTVVEVTGEHISDLTNADVRILDVRDGHTIRRLPQNIQAFFPNLIGIQWSAGVVESISASDLAAFPSLQVLGFSNNRIESLSSDLFGNTTQLGWISFFNNSIQSVGENLFAGLNQLQTANFLENQCINVFANTPEAIQALNANLPLQCPFAEEGVTFTCVFREISWGIIGPQYGCEPTVTVVGNRTDLVRVVGVHPDGLSNADVRILDVRNEQLLSRLPQNIATFFPNLIGIQWSVGSLTALTANDLQPFPNLQVLALSNNQISSLNSNLFTNTNQLQWISFFNNSLSGVGNNLFSPLTNLSFANFLENPCISVLANTPQAIQDLNNQLPLQCPLVPSEECPEACLDLINSFEDYLASKVDKLENTVYEQSKLIARYEDRLETLESQIRMLIAKA